jgi:hypothetical protein
VLTDTFDFGLGDPMAGPYTSLSFTSLEWCEKADPMSRRASRRAFLIGKRRVGSFDIALKGFPLFVLF